MIYEYFKGEFEGGLTILVQLNPNTYEGLELSIYPDKTIGKRELQFDEDIYEDLEVDGFKPASALEFNLYLKGVTGQ